MMSNGRSKLQNIVHAVVTFLVLSLPGTRHCSILCGAEGDEVSTDQTTNRWHLREPFWNSRVVYDESVLFLSDDKLGGDSSRAASASLLLLPSRILKVTSADGTSVYESERDYVLLEGERTLRLAEGSRIKFLKTSDLYPPLGTSNSIAHRAGHADQGVLFDNGHWFHDHQVAITYETNEEWAGYRPAVAHESLKRTLDRLKHGNPVTIAVSGDSITFGLNASKLTGASPHQPIYPELFAAQLRAVSKSSITMVNRAVGGWRLENGLEDLNVLLECKPDLILIAYGMNHFGSRDSAGFKKLQTTMLERIHKQLPEAEVILVAPMHGNVHWVHTPAEQFESHRLALASLVGQQVALADLTTLWGEMLERKRDIDLTGNGVNHPNDFGHRVYASALLGLLLE